MKDIEFIKWMCEKAEGFQWSSDYDTIAIRIVQKLSTEKQYTLGINIDNELPQFEILFYPLLLQRAIEGVNRESKFTVNSYFESIAVCKNGDAISVPFDITCFDSIDKAKEATLLYIYEQEANNE